MRNQLTGNAGLYHVARELSRRGWHAIPTVRNARGSDLYAVSSDEAIVHRIQSKALSKKAPVPLGAKLDTLRSDWWVVTIDANTDKPTCFILTLGEVQAERIVARTLMGECPIGSNRKPMFSPRFKSDGTGSDILALSRTVRQRRSEMIRP